MLHLLLVHPTLLLGELMMTALQQQPDMTVIGCVTTKEQALAKLRLNACDMLLLDSHLPHGEADALLETVTRRLQPPKVLITGLPDVETIILRYLESGATGYLLEKDSLDEFIYKIRCSHRHEFPLPPRLAAKLLARLAELKRLALELNGYRREALDVRNELTLRECEVLHLIEQGCTNEQISRRLMIELGTVKNHVHNILDKLGVSNRQHAAHYARYLWTTTDLNRLQPMAS